MGVSWAAESSRERRRCGWRPISDEGSDRGLASGVRRMLAASRVCRTPARRAITIFCNFLLSDPGSIDTIKARHLCVPVHQSPDFLCRKTKSQIVWLILLQLRISETHSDLGGGFLHCVPRWKRRKRRWSACTIRRRILRFANTPATTATLSASRHDRT